MGITKTTTAAEQKKKQLNLLKTLKQKRADAEIEKLQAEAEKAAAYERRKENLIRQTNKRKIELGIGAKLTSTDIILNERTHLRRPSGDKVLNHKAFKHPDTDPNEMNKLAIIQDKSRDPSGQTTMGPNGFNTGAVRRTNLKGVGLSAVSSAFTVLKKKLEIYDLAEEEIRDKEAIENFMARFGKLWRNIFAKYQN